MSKTKPRQMTMTTARRRYARVFGPVAKHCVYVFGIAPAICGCAKCREKVIRASCKKHGVRLSPSAGRGRRKA